MFFKIGRLEVSLQRNYPFTGDLLPKGAVGGDPVGKSSWVWWLGWECILKWMPQQGGWTDGGERDRREPEGGDQRPA